jgi:hypothetical protein
MGLMVGHLVDGTLVRTIIDNDNFALVISQAEVSNAFYTFGEHLYRFVVVGDDEA